MAVFEYRGILAASGKQVHGVRDADNATVLRASLKREGVLLTGAREEQKARRGGATSLQAASLFRRMGLAAAPMISPPLAARVNAGIPLVPAVGGPRGEVDKLPRKP